MDSNNPTESQASASAQGAADNLGNGYLRFSIAHENQYFQKNNCEIDKYTPKDIMRATLFIHEMIFHISEGYVNGPDHEVSGPEIYDAITMLMEYSDKILPEADKITKRDAAILTLNGFLGSTNFNTYLSYVNETFELQLTKEQVEGEILDKGYKSHDVIIYCDDANDEQFPSSREYDVNEPNSAPLYKEPQNQEE